MNTPTERFWTGVEKTESCWNWTKGKTANGYGTFSVDGALVYTHRFSYEMHVGQIPEGLQIDHLCENQSCCNPEHLEPVTQQENLARYSQRRTHCKWGHELTPDNTYVPAGGRARRCRICLREKQARTRDRAKAANPPEPKALKEFCKNGHAYSEDNTSYTKEGWRRCRTCDRQKAARNKQRKREGMAA